MNYSWAASGHEGPIHLWDAFNGDLRCSYRGYNNVDELEAAISVTFSADGQNIFCGYKKNVKIFSTGRPGREYIEYPVAHGASCLTASLAQPGVVAIGKITFNLHYSLLFIYYFIRYVEEYYRAGIAE